MPVDMARLSVRLDEALLGPELEGGEFVGDRLEIGNKWVEAQRPGGLPFRAMAALSGRVANWLASLLGFRCGALKNLGARKARWLSGCTRVQQGLMLQGCRNCG